MSAFDWNGCPKILGISVRIHRNTHGTGYCYSKSHLLAALLRANDIPAGLCYQRLTVSDNKPPFCIHGLNAVYLEQHGWYRLDARGNKSGVTAEFCPPKSATMLINRQVCFFQTIRNADSV
ncbi:MAG: transglutaminase family protein [Desulfosarcina sp.]|nr:transglutaminase family protein [Desulfobacterales bacterium]